MIFTENRVIMEVKLVTHAEPVVTNLTSKAVQVVDVFSSPHYHVQRWYLFKTLRANPSSTKQPVGRKKNLIYNIVRRGDCLGNPPNIKVENNGAVGYVGSSLTEHNPLVLFTNCEKINQCNVSVGQYVQNGRIAIERCTRSGPKKLTKPITKGFPAIPLQLTIFMTTTAFLKY